jgi:hypothetical protein
VVLKLKYRVFTFGIMGVSNLTLYNNLRHKLGDQESHELVEFIHSEVKAEMETVKTNLDNKTNVFLTKDDKIDLIDRIETVRIELIDRIEAVRIELIDRIEAVRVDLIDRINSLEARVNKAKTEIIIWMVSLIILQYIVTILTKKLI